MDVVSITPESVNAAVDKLVVELQAAEIAKYQASFPNSPIQPDCVVAKSRSKFIAIDIGLSGAYLVEKATGELYNIKAYGVPDRNKKVKADIGNVFTVNATELLNKRWNYLR